MDPQSVPAQEDILRRICGEYLEMPGLRLKREQAQRLWGLDDATCAQMLDVLVANGFLCFVDGRYGRSSEGALRTAAPMVKAGLEFRTIRNAKSPAA